MGPLGRHMTGKTRSQISSTQAICHQRLKHTNCRNPHGYNHHLAYLFACVVEEPKQIPKQTSTKNTCQTLLFAKRIFPKLVTLVHLAFSYPFVSCWAKLSKPAPFQCMNPKRFKSYCVPCIHAESTTSSDYSSACTCFGTERTMTARDVTRFYPVQKLLSIQF